MKNLLIVLIFLSLISCGKKEISHVIVGCREEKLSESINYPEYVFIDHDGAGIIDVTKPPFNVDNTGVNDVTEKLIAVYNSIWNAHLAENEEFRINLNDSIIWRGHGPARIIYFPDGIYKVSGSIEYTINRQDSSQYERYVRLKNRMTKEDSLRNPYFTMSQKNKLIHFQGQSAENTIIKLIDNASNFQDTANPVPVVSFIPKGEHSNIAFMNTFANITIDIGSGNPGASGLRFHDNNCGSVRSVRIISSDPNGLGAIGLDLTGEKTGLGFIKDIEIKGFDVGVQIASWGIGHTIEHITIENQNKVGIQVDNNQIAIRDIRSVNQVPAIEIVGIKGTHGSGRAMATIVDGNFSGGNANTIAINNKNGFFFARNILIDGYNAAVNNIGDTLVGSMIKELTSHDTYSLFDTVHESLNLKIEDAPEIPWDNFDDWANVQDYGAVPDDNIDDSEAIQKAIDAGKSTVIFPVGVYNLDTSVYIRNNVRRFNFLWSRMRPNPKKIKDLNAVFIIQDGKPENVLIENLSYGASGEFYWFDQATKRTVIYKDMFMGGDGSGIKNSVPGGRAFIEMVHGKIHYDSIPVFHFKKMDVWIRSLNPEGSNTIKMLNEGGTVWILGFKIEAGGIDFITKAGGSTEVLGGTLNRYGRGKRNLPSMIIDNSNFSIVAAETGPRHSKIMVREIRCDSIKELTRIELPLRGQDMYKTRVIPLYSGRGVNNQD